MIWVIKFMKKSKGFIAVVLVVVILLSTFLINGIFGSGSEILTEKKDYLNALSTMSVDYGNYVNEFGLNDALDDIILNSDNYVGGVTASFEEEKTVYKLSKDEYVEFKFNVLNDGAYNLNLVFSDVDESSEKYNFKLEIDNIVPFKACEKLTLNSVWVDDGGIRTLTNGDQVNALQKHKTGFSTQTVIDMDGVNVAPYKFMLKAGEHTIKIYGVGKAFYLAELKFTKPEEIKSYKDVAKDYSNYKK